MRSQGKAAGLWDNRHGPVWSAASERAHRLITAAAGGAVRSAPAGSNGVTGGPLSSSRRVHTPTGWLSIEDLIRSLIVELGVTPPSLFSKQLASWVAPASLLVVLPPPRDMADKAEENLTAARLLTLPRQACEAGVLDEEQSEALEFLEGLRVTADYHSDHVTNGQARMACDMASRLLDHVLAEERRDG